MTKKFPVLEEEKTINISLATGIFVVILLTFIEFFGDVIRMYITSYTPWLEKLVIMIILAIFLGIINSNHESIKKLENFLLSIGRKKNAL